MNKKSTKRTLLSSVLSLVLCMAMLIGTTFAWFTDNVTSAGNTIQSGTLDVDLIDAAGNSMEGEVIEFITADNRAQDAILWEPGCTYETEAVFVVNKGNLALKYQITINGITGDAKLLEAIEWTVTVNGTEIALADLNGILLAGETSKAIVISGHMKEEAGNEYQGLTVEGISISVVATQLTYESDSFGDQYDSLATFMNKNAEGEWEIGELGQLIYFAKSVNEGNSYEGETVVLSNDIDLNGINWTPIGNADADEFVGFKGTFDGQNFTISNLKINSTSWGKGLFGYMDASTNATVKNLGVNNANIVASDCAGVIVGYATNGTFENIHVTGDVSVVGTVADGYVGGIAGCGYNANFNNCSVIANAGSEITSAGSFAGGIVGYQCNNKKAITDCKVANLTVTGYAAVGGVSGIIQTGSNFTFTNNSVENVVLNKTRIDGNPSIGALVGNYSGTAETKLTGKVSNVTLNGSHVEYSAYNKLYGSEYSGATTPNFDVTGVTVDGITNNLGQVTIVNTAADLKTALANGGNILLNADINMDVADTGFTVGKGVTSKLDLNGHDIIAKSTSTQSVQLFSVNGNLNIVGNGTILLTNDSFPWNTSYRYTAINIREIGEVTLGEGVNVVCEGGSATADGYGMTYAVDIYTTGTLNVNGASLHSNYIAIRCFYGNSVVNVNNGSSITSSRNNYGIWPQSAPGATITVADGVSYTVNESNGIYIFN